MKKLEFLGKFLRNPRSGSLTINDFISMSHYCLGKLYYSPLYYIASALSFMLENLGKPVIITGSQIPCFETRSDGRDNFLGALILAGNYPIPEVGVYFRHQVDFRSK